MSRPSAKICAESLPSALRSRAPGLSARRAGRARVLNEECRRSVHSSNDAARRQAAEAQGVWLYARNAQPRTGVYMRRFATAAVQPQTESIAGQTEDARAGFSGGPLQEYEGRVQQGRLRDDPYQRGGCFLYLLSQGKQ
jgi:protein AFG1